MNEGQNLNDGGRGLDAAGGFVLRKFRRGALVFLAAMALVFAVGAMMGEQVFAATSASALYNKALAGSLQKCYNNIYMVDSISDASAVYNVRDVIKDDSDGVIKVPYGYGNSLKDGDISCVELFAGWQGMQILTGNAVGLLGSDAWNIGGSTLLNKLGYVAANDNGDVSSKCVSFDYDLRGTRHTNRLCYRINDDGEINPINPESYDGERQTGDIEIWMEVGGSRLRAATSEGRMNDIFQFTGTMSTTDFEAGMFSAASALAGLTHSGANPQNVKPNFGGDDGEGDSFAAYKIDNWSDAAERALKNLTSFSSFEETRFSQQDKYDMYMGYLTGIYNGFVTSQCSNNKNDSAQSVPVNVGGETEWCVVGGDFSSDNKYVNIFTKNENMFLDLTTNSTGLIDAIRELNVDELTLTMANTTTGQIGQTVIGGSGSDSGRNDACYDGSGALGWIICPVVKMVSGIGEYMWGVIEENLQIPAEGLFKNTTGVRDAWDAIRNISNIVFVILFLFVIFSQLTGIGIDNYGIKKILPKLILVAILINLSYIICELAVDISNILGMGLNSLLTEQASGIPVPSAMSTGEVVGGWIVDTVIAGGGVTLFLLLNPAGAIVAAAGLGLAVLGLLITAVVSIFFMYITLVVRQAGVILMIVLAPIALACYMLPNTEKLFKKWFDLFKALLIVYPICGALIGAGQLAGAVLASINTPSMRVAAMLVQVVPFFLLPMIIRNSLSLMGNIGGRLSTWGRNLGRRGSSAAQGAIRNSKGYQEWSRYQQDRSSVARANRIRERLGNRTNLSERQRIQLLDAERTINAQTQKNAEAQVGEYMLDSNLAVSRMQSAKEAKEYKAYQDQFAGFTQEQLAQMAGLRANADGTTTQVSGTNGWFAQAGGTQRMAALIGAMEAQGMERDIFNLLRNNDDIGKDAAVMRALTGSKNKVLKAYGKKGNGMSYNNFMKNGGMRHYVEEKGTDVLDGMDDKALAEINAYSSIGNYIMGSDLLVEAAARMNSQDAVDQIDIMLNKRSGFNITGEQLARFNASTVTRLEARAGADPAVAKMMISASNDIAADPRLLSSLSRTSRDAVNRIRVANGQPQI